MSWLWYSIAAVLATVAPDFASVEKQKSLRNEIQKLERELETMTVLAVTLEHCAIGVSPAADARATVRVSHSVG